MNAARQLNLIDKLKLGILGFSHIIEPHRGRGRKGSFASNGMSDAPCNGPRYRMKRRKAVLGAHRQWPPRRK